VGPPDDPEFRAAFAGYIEWGTRLAFANSQPGATPPLGPDAALGLGRRTALHPARRRVNNTKRRLPGREGTCSEHDPGPVGAAAFAP
jgi:hypothetical protein